MTSDTIKLETNEATDGLADAVIAARTVYSAAMEEQATQMLAGPPNDGNRGLKVAADAGAERKRGELQTASVALYDQVKALNPQLFAPKESEGAHAAKLRGEQELRSGIEAMLMERATQTGHPIPKNGQFLDLTGLQRACCA